MLRFYKEFMEECLMVLLYIKYRNDVSMDNITRWVARASWPDELKAIVRASPYTSYTPPDSIDDMIGTIKDQLKAINEERGSGEDGNLINAIIRILQLPFARNAINGEQLKALRTALLLPEELGGLTARLEARELTCGQCSRPLRNEEMVTISRDRQGVVLLCHACMRPSVMACDHGGCQGHVGLDKKYRAMHKKRVDCGEHAEGGEEVTVPMEAGRYRGDDPVAIPMPNAEYWVDAPNTGTINEAVTFRVNPPDLPTVPPTRPGRAPTRRWTNTNPPALRINWTTEQVRLIENLRYGADPFMAPTPPTPPTVQDAPDLPEADAGGGAPNETE